jgi:predicted 3-demethylubiquinone-9 3-methyltransferase (glyoxalase superfamily)
MGKKITPCLWFDTQAEEAATFYTSVFKNSRITDVARYAEGCTAPTRPRRTSSGNA